MAVIVVECFWCGFYHEERFVTRCWLQGICDVWDEAWDDDYAS